jgi:hypothetical protein
MRSALIGTVTATLFGVTAGAASAQTSQAGSIRFADAELGPISGARFDVALTGRGGPPRWEVVEDPTANGGRALAERSGDRTSHRFPLAILKDLTLTSVEVSIGFKAISGSVDQAAGVAFRLKDANNYYVVRANALENNVRLYTVVAGDRKQIAGADLKVPAGQWQTLTVRALGPRIEVEFNGQQVIRKDDSTFAQSGRVALWTKADSLTHFETLTVQPLQ